MTGSMPVGDVLREAATRPGVVVVLTGAGISAESGIPTFRGPEGYWTVGSRQYQPEEMATQAMFVRQPEAVWAWYLYRRGVCRAASPNPAHRALVDLERALEDRFVLATQNVDGLHLLAGSGPERTLQVHGNLHFMRCARACSGGRQPVPEDLGTTAAAAASANALPADAASRLRCARCGGWMRPHVLWFDETYDEENYRFETALQAAGSAALLLVVGTSGATTLPMHMAQIAVARGSPMLDVNPEPNPFASLALRSRWGCAVREKATTALPNIVRRCIETFSAGGRNSP